jgi:hypothetical protein
MCAWMVVWYAPFWPDPVPAGLSRPGLDQRLDNVCWRLQRGVVALTALVARPDPPRDAVPLALQRSVGHVRSTVWFGRGPAPFDRLSARRLWGLLDWAHGLSMKALQTQAAGLAAAWVCCVGLAWRFGHPAFTGLGLAAALALSALISLRMSMIYDEFYINLRHAWTLVHHGTYSVNSLAPAEGSVDTLPLLLTAALHTLGVELESGWVLVSLSGNALVILAGYLVLRAATGDRVWALLGAGLLGLLPGVLWVGATGFTAVFFTGYLLLASWALLVTPRTGWALALLALATLVRTEGVLFALLVVTYAFALRPAQQGLPGHGAPGWARRWVGATVAVVAPFLVSMAVRAACFGSAMPTPIAYKNSGLNLGFVQHGTQLLAQMVTERDMHVVALLVVVLALALVRSGRFAALRDSVALSAVAGLFILPYFLGGGDWLFDQWNRYGLPLEVTLSLAALVAVRLAAGSITTEARSRVLAVAVAVALGGAYAMESSHRLAHSGWRLVQSLPGLTWGNRMTDHLALLGQLLDHHLPPRAVVASTEEATLMYHARREMMGLLGVSQPEIARERFEPLVPGDILNRKRALRVLERHRPEALLLYQPADLGPQFSRARSAAALLPAVRRSFFNAAMVDSAYYRVGSFEALKRMGYNHHLVVYDDAAFSIFLHQRVEDHVEGSLRRSGLVRWGTLAIPYEVTPALSRSFLPAGPRVLPLLR